MPRPEDSTFTRAHDRRDAKSGVTMAGAATFADKVLAELQDAFRSGWADEVLLRDSDFDAVRSREDFRKLLRDVEAKAAAGSPPDDTPPESGKP
jgi:hypothetical protein